MKRKKKKVKLEKKKKLENPVEILDSSDDDVSVDGVQVNGDVEMDEREHLSILDDDIEDEDDDIRVVKVKVQKREVDEGCLDEMMSMSDVEEDIEQDVDNEYD